MACSELLSWHTQAAVLQCVSSVIVRASIQGKTSHHQEAVKLKG